MPRSTGSARSQDILPPRRAPLPRAAITDHCSSRSVFRILPLAHKRFSLNPDPWPSACTTPQHYRRLPLFQLYGCPYQCSCIDPAWDVMSRNAKCNFRKGPKITAQISSQRTLRQRDSVARAITSENWSCWIPAWEFQRKAVPACSRTSIDGIQHSPAQWNSGNAMDSSR